MSNNFTAQKPQIYKHHGHWQVTTDRTTIEHNTWAEAIQNATPPHGSRTCINCLRPMHKQKNRPLGTHYARTNNLCETCYYSRDTYIVKTASKIRTTPNTNTTPQHYKKLILKQHHKLQRLADKLATQYAMDTDPALARYITARRKRLDNHTHN